ncbi:MAG: YggT family protein [Firmicutes bacterium]|nr:YggT family protein [Bacillota bacterium]
MTYVLCYAIRLFVEVLTWMLILRAIFSWFARDPYSTAGKIYTFLIRLTEPIVMPCRQALSRLNTGMFDFSVFLAMILIQAVGNILIMLITRIF